MLDPNTIDKYIYIQKTPTWKVRFFYLLGIIFWIPIAFVTAISWNSDPFTTWFVVPIVVILTVHYFFSFGLNLFYRQFNLKKHRDFLFKYWYKKKQYDSVDIYLPICGEDVSILRRTWKHVQEIDYPNKKVYVLDDSRVHTQKHKRLAEKFGFVYFERPNKGEMKKAGNLKYAFGRTSGTYIAILDADFAPHRDFLRELVPYLKKRQVGIVQSPQYFPTHSSLHKDSPLSYGAARAQEVFYRVILVARDRLMGAHCCGTCAVYKREALESIGGFVQMGHSEDAHTGFAITSHGWRIKYIPVAVSLGLCPDDIHAFFHQQHRWCLGNLLLILSKKFWGAKIPFRIKFCYLTGFLFYIHQPFVILFSFQLFWVLFFYNDYISLWGGIVYYPHILWAFSYMFFFYLVPFRWGYLYAILLRMYSYSHSFFSLLIGHSVGWIATGSKQSNVSSAYRQTMYAVGFYLILYLFLLGLALLGGFLYFFDLDYYSIQFWLFYNFVLSTFLFYKMYQYYRSTKKRPDTDEEHDPEPVTVRLVDGVVPKS